MTSPATRTHGDTPSPDVRGEVIEALRSSPYFARIDEEQLAALAEQTRIIDFQNDAAVFRAGDPADALYLVLVGQIRISRQDPEGGETVLGIISEGEVFGEIAVIDGAARSASAAAVGRTQLAAVDGEAFLTMLHEQPDATVQLMKTVTARQRSTIEQHHRLVFAYHELETRAREREASQSMARRARWRGLAFVFGLLLLIQSGVWAWLDYGEAIDQMVVSVFAGTPDKPADRGQPRLDLVTVTSRAIERDISLIGKIDPGYVYDITAPFDGTITQLGFSFGGRVEHDQELLRLATDELEKQRRDAKVALIEAQQGLDEVKNWETGSEVADAKRSLAAAEEALAIGRNRFEGTRSLYNAGVLSREELDQAESSLADAQRSAAAAQESFDAAMQKGSEINLHVAELKLENAEAEIKDIESKLAQASVRSPASGVALKPLTDGGGEGQDQPIALGTGVSARQLLLSIGDMESLTIEANVSELDIDAVEPGLEVEIRSEVLGDQILSGVVETTASQAAPGDRGSVLAQYPITVRINELAPAQRARLRLGMSAELRVIVYRNPDALVIPHAAVAGDRDAWYVRRFDPVTGRVSDVPITTGRSLPDGIEVLKGLGEGDQLLRDPYAADDEVS